MKFQMNEVNAVLLADSINRLVPGTTELAEQPERMLQTALEIGYALGRLAGQDTYRDLGHPSYMLGGPAHGTFYHFRDLPTPIEITVPATSLSKMQNAHDSIAVRKGRYNKLFDEIYVWEGFTS